MVVIRIAETDVTKVIEEQKNVLAELEKSAKGKGKETEKQALEEFKSSMVVADYETTDADGNKVQHLFKRVEIAISDKVQNVSKCEEHIQTKVSRADLYCLEEQIKALADKIAEEPTDDLKQMKADLETRYKAYEKLITDGKLYNPSEEESTDGIALAYAIIICNGKGFKSLKRFSKVANLIIGYYNDFLDIDNPHNEERASVKRAVEEWADNTFFNNIPNFKTQCNNKMVKDICLKCADVVKLGKKGFKLDVVKKNDEKACVNIAVHTLSWIMYNKLGMVEPTKAECKHKYSAQ